MRFHEILFQTDFESFIPKKKNLSRCQYQNKKSLFTNPIFSEGFGIDHINHALNILKILLSMLFFTISFCRRFLSILLNWQNI